MSLAVYVSRGVCLSRCVSLVVYPSRNVSLAVCVSYDMCLLPCVSLAVRRPPRVVMLVCVVRPHMVRRQNDDAFAQGQNASDLPPLVGFILVSLPMQILKPDTTRRCECIVALVLRDQRPVCSQRVIIAAVSGNVSTCRNLGKVDCLRTYGALSGDDHDGVCHVLDHQA